MKCLSLFYRLMFASLTCLFGIFCFGKPWQNSFPAEAEAESLQTELTLIAATEGEPQESDFYSKAEAAFKAKEYEEVIRLLSGPAELEPNNFKLNILLAKAQVERCALLKAKGDKSYKELIMKPYETSQRLHKMYEKEAEPYYIAAKCLLINDRPSRAGRTIKKAIFYSTQINADYFVVLGDAWSCLPRYKITYDSAKAAYEKALAIEKDDQDFRLMVEKIS
jgi:hypothetical protein